MKFKVAEKQYRDQWVVISIEPEINTIAQFNHEGLAQDYVDFLNDKYVDKEINKEWPEINRRERIKYHLEQLTKLIIDERLVWNSHGTGVK